MGMTEDTKKWIKCKCGCEAFELYEDYTGAARAKVPLISVCWCCRKEEEIDG